MARLTTKELILKKATDLFYRYGYSNTPIRKITEKVGVENPVIYYYFKSKDHLLFAIIESIADDLIGGLQEIIDRVPDPVERVREMIFFHITILERKKKPVKVFVEDNDKLPPKLRMMIKEKEKQIYHLYHTQFELLVEKGMARDIEIPLITFSLIGMINWIYRWFKDGGTLDVRGVADRTISILFSGVIIEPGKSDQTASAPVNGLCAVPGSTNGGESPV